MADNKFERRRLTRDDRYNILGYLAKGLSISEIAERINFHKSTIYRELKRCPQLKEGFIFKKCELLGNKYLVCNQCPKHNHCSKDKIYYNAKTAAKDAHDKKHESHCGPHCAVSELKLINSIVSEKVKKGQSLEYIYHFNKELNFVSLSTIRRMIDNEHLSVRRAHLRRARKYLKKYKRIYTDSDSEIKAKNRAGRTFSDYLRFIEEHDNIWLMELDSVVGKTTDKSRLFTFMLVDQRFQLGRLYQSSESSISVNKEVIKILKVLLKYRKDREIVLLCDNGYEFDNLVYVESEHVHVFYTNPYKSTDKAHCERNHEYFRYVIPKGHSLDDLTQQEIDQIFSNINSYCRKELNWKSPCDLFTEACSKEALQLLKINQISPVCVDLAPKY